MNISVAHPFLDAQLLCTDISVVTFEQIKNRQFSVENCRYLLEMTDQGTRPVYYAGKRELERGILCAYPPMRTMETAATSAITERPMPHLTTPAKLNLEDE